MKKYKAEWSSYHLFDGFIRCVRDKKAYILISLFSVAFFAVFYGIQILDVTYANWLAGGGLDISQHYAGWMFYRRDEWMFPVGDFTGLSYPNRLSVVYMDSIPLLAVIFKLFSSLLPAEFQYFGWYQLSCFVLQGILAVKLLKKYMHREAALCLSGMMFVTAPVFLWRVGLHIALSSQWIILLAFSGIIYYREYFRDSRRQVVLWSVLGFLCTTIHLYFLPMCFMILTGFIFMDICEDKKWKKPLMTLAGFWTGVLVPMYLLGGFSKSMQIAQEDIVRKKTFNLNAFWNAQKWSPFLPSLKLYHYGQSEGFAYLGLGILLGVSFVGITILYFCMRGKITRSQIKGALLYHKTIAILIISIMSAVAAASPVITLGEHILAVLPVGPLENIWSVFRASGRLIWPLYYIILLAFCILIGNMKNHKFVITFLALCLIVQVCDIGGEIWDRGEKTRDRIIFESELKDEGWEIIAQNTPVENIVYVNVSGLDACASLADYAIKHDMTLGKFYYARNMDQVIQQTVIKALNEKSEKDLFLFKPGEVLDQWNQPDLCFYELDRWVIAYPKPIRGLENKRIDVRSRPYHYTCVVTEESQQCEMIDDFLFIHGKGSYCGPDFVVPEGNYSITLLGENLLDAVVYSKSGNEMYTNDREVKQQMQEITFDLSDVQNIQVVLSNPSDHDMVLYEIVIERIP